MVVMAHVGDQIAAGAPAFLVAVAAVGAILGVLAWRHHRRAPAIAAGVVAVVALGAFVTSGEWTWLVEDGSVQAQGVSAPVVALEEGQDLYRIVDGSSVTYEVTERLAGAEGTASGTTTVLAGDLAIDREVPSNSEIGTIVVNVEAFESGSSLRDKRIRHDFLESTEYPYAEFETTSIAGLPDAVEDREPYEVTIEGDLTVREITEPATFAGTVTLDGDRLTAEMSTTILQSSYQIGPIAISGIVTTRDEVGLTFDLVAERTEPDSAAEVGDFVAADLDVGEAPFSSTVQPILEEACASCHVTGGPGNSTFSLETAGDAAEVAADIAMVTQVNYMPPWTASDLSVPFEHDWSLSDDQKQAIAEWAADGGGLDVDPETPLEATSDRVQVLEADVTLRGEPYLGSAQHADDYRCQIYDFPEFDNPVWMRGYQFLPDAEEVVHHGIFFLGGAGARAEAEALDNSDPAPGWQCFGLSGLRNDVQQIGGWAPGKQPNEYPAGTGRQIEAGDFLVVQIHYHYDHDFPWDSSAVGVDLASDEEIAAAGGSLGRITGSTYLAPAEVPCSDAESGPLCDRTAVLADISARFGRGAAFIPDALLAMCGQELAPYLEDTDGIGDASCLHTINNPGRVIGVHGHMHEFGKTFRMTLNPGTPEERILLDIPNWSFEWQLDYRPTEEIIVDRDDTLLIECSWDRNIFPMAEPRYITWNEGTTDEMCYSSLTTMPAE